MMLDGALDYAARGWAVLPCNPGDKTPLAVLAPHGSLSATTDEATIRAWWRRAPNANVAIATGSISAGLVVLDVDVARGEGVVEVRGDRSLVELVRDRGPIGMTRQHGTPRGGTHYLFRAPSGVRIPNSQSRIGAHLDVRGEGGYVVAPPSRMNAGEYFVESPHDVAEVGGWLLEAMRPPAAVAAPEFARRPGRWSLDVEARAGRALAYVERCEPAVSGQGGHDQTYQVALVLVRGFDLPRPVAREILRWYSSRCSPPWSERELEHKLTSAEAARALPGFLLERRGAA